MVEYVFVFAPLFVKF